MQTDHLTKRVRTRLDRRLAANGLSEVAMGLLLVGSNGLTALDAIGVRAHENPWIVALAAAALLAAALLVPLLRRRFVDPRLGFARAQGMTARSWICLAAIVVLYVILLRMNVNGIVIAAIFPLALAFMAHYYAAPRMYMAGIVVAGAMAYFATLSLSPTAWLSCTALVAAVSLVSTGFYAFIRFIRITPELDPVTS